MVDADDVRGVLEREYIVNWTGALLMNHNRTNVRIKTVRQTDRQTDAGPSLYDAVDAASVLSSCAISLLSIYREYLAAYCRLRGRLRRETVHALA